MTERRSQLRLGGLAVLVASASWLCWFGMRSVDEEPVAAELPPELLSRSGHQRAATIARQDVVASRAVPQFRQPSSERAAAPDHAGHPHPITPAHVRIAHENQLIQQLNDALDLRDAARMRPLVEEYARDFPDDPNAMVAGYQRIADCLEEPGERAREAAQTYYDRERASTLRRYVRRVCLE
jgi:hypothetical protein